MPINSWRQLDGLLRDGGRLFNSPFGFWFESSDGEAINVYAGSAKALLRRDLAVVASKTGLIYSFRHKYETLTTTRPRRAGIVPVATTAGRLAASSASDAHPGRVDSSGHQLDSEIHTG